MPGPNRSSGARRHPRPDSPPTRAHPLSPEDVDHQIGGLGHEPRLRISFRTIPEVSRPPAPHDRLTIHGRRPLVDRFRAGRPSTTSPTKCASPAPQLTKWVRRRRAEGDPGLHDSSSRPWLHRTEPLPMRRIASASHGATASSALHGSAQSLGYPNNYNAQLEPVQGLRRAATPGGFRCPGNQPLRTRCAPTRRARGHLDARQFR
ncbi:leucine zipper domain-containing protein [Streptomyces sp. TUS-ST3]|uniref:leucine zipper domain-containing protein n=1 Tax=Streptomyces sp. TUS-ST3 TaxID=3025591 RepID=UPI0032EA6143